MKQQFELLAPGGDLDSIKATIIAGADAIYCGLDSFNARNRAANLSFEQLTGVIALAHKNSCQVFLTLNIIILQQEIPALVRLLNKLVNSKIDAVIVQDLGLFYLLSKHFPSLDVHASTQVTTHNEGQILFLNKLGASRVNLSRELNIKEIKALTALGHQHNILSEVFVHGSYCIGFSGLCYMSSLQGNSGNRGRCSQPCRDQYETTKVGNDFPLNLKDNSAYFDLPALADAGVDSLKVEGRIKGASYVYTVVKSWQQHLQNFNDGARSHDNSELYKVFNRDFSNGFLKGEISKQMFIDNPRDHTLKHIEEINVGADADVITEAKQALGNEKLAMQQMVMDEISHLSTEKIQLTLKFLGKLNQRLKVSVSTSESEFVVYSQSLLTKADNATIDGSAIEKRFKSLNNEQYHLEKLLFDELDSGLCIPFKELTAIKNRIVFLFNDSVEPIAPVELPILKSAVQSCDKARLGVLIASEKDISISDADNVDIYYKLPESLKKGCAKLIALFKSNQHLIPWFPAILIGDDYLAAEQFLKLVQPKQIVTNNTGIAYLADKDGIDWVAGPYLNISNTYSLLAMKERFNCCGAFISNELNRNQIRKIIAPERFKLFYSIYHPIMLMTSRQCFFQQTVGCKKTKIDQRCIDKCKKSASIINLKGEAFAIDKQQGGYTCLYNDKPFLNTEIINDLPDNFSTYFIDLTSSSLTVDKEALVKLFADRIAGKAGSEEQLRAVIGASTNSQYKKGL